MVQTNSLRGRGKRGAERHTFSATAATQMIRAVPSEPLWKSAHAKLREDEPNGPQSSEQEPHNEDWTTYFCTTGAQGEPVKPGAQEQTEAALSTPRHTTLGPVQEAQGSAGYGANNTV